MPNVVCRDECGDHDCAPGGRKGRVVPRGQSLIGEHREQNDNYRRVSDRVDLAEFKDGANEHSAKDKGCGTCQGSPSKRECQGELNDPSGFHIKGNIEPKAHLRMSYKDRVRPLWVSPLLYRRPH